MKKIEAIIRPDSLEKVRKSLNSCGYPGITISEVDGHGKQKGLTQQWRGEKFKIEFLPKIKVEIVITDKDLDKIIGLIEDAAKTGEIGDGKIFVSTIEEVVRIRTGERGESAL